MIFTTPEQMRFIESVSDKTALSYGKLMDNAASEVTHLITMIMNEIDVTDGIVILCGHGNNAADGFTVAKNLADYGVPLSVVLTDGDPDSVLAINRYCEMGNEKNIEVLNLNDNIDKAFSRFSSAAIIVDAVFGIGFRGDALPPAVKACFSFVKRCSAIKIAIDVPSGGNCLNGEADENTLQCDYTVTFSYKKIGMLSEPLKSLCGEIIVSNIGLSKNLFEGLEFVAAEVIEDDISQLFPERKANSHKGDFGRVLNIAGSNCMSGAAALSTLSALRSGAGLVRLASTETVINRLASSIFEATYLPLAENKDGLISDNTLPDILTAAKSMTAISIGSGLGISDSTKKIVYELITNADCPIILDADGINCLVDNIDIIKNTKNKLIITPHAAELTRIHKASGINCDTDRLSIAIALSKAFKIVVVAKGSPTFIVGDGKVLVCTLGNPGLSKGGSGDVLTGIIAGFTAQGLSPFDAAAAGAYVHGLAADLVAEKSSKIGMLPYDVINELPFVFKRWNR